MITVLAAALIVGGIAIGLGVAARLRGDPRISSVRLVSDGSVVPNSSSMLTRSDDGVDFTFTTSGLLTGHIVTLRAVIFNQPGNCPRRVGRLRCNEGDVGNPDVGGSIVFLTGLFYRQAVGAVTLQGHLGADDKSQAVVGGGLTNPRGADVHLVLLDHGPPTQSLYNEMLTTLAGGCKDPPPGSGTPGPNNCLDIQISAHQK